jgi:S-phase kinase-associated protein 1
MATEKGKGAAAVAAKGGAAVAAEKGKRGRPTAAETEADEGKTIVKLKTSDEQIFEVPAKLAKLFKVIADVVDKGYADDTIPLPNVHSSALAKVIKYCDNHLRMSAEPADACSWDKEFVSRLDVAGLYDVIMAAHYLDYERLLDLLCKAVADIMAGKTTEQIRATFGIKNDFTPEEEAEIARENPWA